MPELMYGGSDMAMMEDLKLLRDMTADGVIGTRVTTGYALQGYSEADERGQIGVRVQTGVDQVLDRRGTVLAGVAFEAGQHVALIADYRYNTVIVLGATLPLFDGDSQDPPAETDYTTPRIAIDLWDGRDTLGGS